MKEITHYAFIAGVVMALIVGLAKPQLGNAASWITSIIVILGLLVGFVNITRREVKDFMLVGAVLIIAGYVGQASDLFAQVEIIGWYLAGVLDTFMAFVVPATIAVALRGVWSMGATQ